ncbi:MAG: ribosome biogenesis GTP-binding protein YihA/YsxC [Defluviitaleaceae bacterium]|nr:ribosome biogenesis GTP-binding protein YihA/YsxC [Defluviitaleaceae bacterium]
MEIPMKINLTVAVEKKGYPEREIKEVAFVGRSNVGKSSLINTLLGKKIAKTSQNPGKTRTINFYNIDEKFHLVDLPGYGYAKAPKTEIAKWGKMIEAYLKEREQLQAVALLLDIRHAPSDNDRLMYDWLLHYGYEMIIIATKLDKIKRSQVQKHISIIRKEISFEGEIFTFSSLNKTGADALWNAILQRTCSL